MTEEVDKILTRLQEGLEVSNTLAQLQTVVNAVIDEYTAVDNFDVGEECTFEGKEGIFRYGYRKLTAKGMRYFAMGPTGQTHEFGFAPKKVNPPKAEKEAYQDKKVDIGKLI